MTHEKDKKKTVETFWARIYVGFKERETGKNIGSIRKTRKICQRFVDDLSYCVTIKPIEYRYCKGWERGVEIGLINYPRFPVKNFQTKVYALSLAETMKAAFKQIRVTVVMPKETIMLGQYD